MDWSKIENIIFVSAIGVLALFLVVSAIAVIVKGKRRCNGFDVFLRIMSSLVLALSAVLFAAFVFTQLDGSYRIDVSGEPALIFGGTSVVLPLPFIFVAVSTTVGSNLVTALLVISLIALICDCLLANVKKVKATENKTDAVEEVANDVRQTEEPAAANDIAAAAHTDERSDNAEGSIKPETDDNSTVEPAETEADDYSADKPWYNEDGKFDMDAREHEETEPAADITDDESDEPSEVRQENEQDMPQTDDRFEYDAADIENTESTAVDAAQETAEDPFEFAEESGEETSDAAQAEQSEYETSEDVDDESAEEQIEQDDSDDEEFDLTEPDEQEEFDDDETPWYAQTGEDNEDVSEERVAEQEPEQLEKTETEQAAYADTVEPDRDIYIPEIRTVERTESVKREAISKRESREKTERAKPQRRAVPPRQSKQPQGPTMAERAASAAIRNGAKRTSKLPVNRRYVILDRRSAVNIFSDYLKERDKTDKDKLESSINTIIIK